MRVAEYSVNQLADNEVQAPPSKLWHRMESRVPSHGGIKQTAVCVPNDAGLTGCVLSKANVSTRHLQFIKLPEHIIHDNISLI